MQVREAHGLSTPLAALDSAAITSRARPDAKTRVRGIEVAGYAGIWGSTLASAETHWASSCTCDEIVVGRQKVTNLRLPGQYDERLFSQAGLNLQGPYYNRARWYLPGVGRYLEPDPLALAGAFNGYYGPDWYGYALANPLRFRDPSGLEVIVGNYVVSPVLVWMLQQVNSQFPSQDVVVTGGDRYRDADGNIRSSSNDQIIPDSAPYSKHLLGEAVDFYVTGTDDAAAAAAALLAGFDWVKSGYDNGHVHADIGGKGGERLVCK